MLQISVPKAHTKHMVTIIGISLAGFMLLHWSIWGMLVTVYVEPFQIAFQIVIN